MSEKYNFLFFIIDKLKLFEFNLLKFIKREEQLKRRQKYKVIKENKTIKKIKTIYLNEIINSIIIHLGKNPKKGGRPPKDNKGIIITNFIKKFL